MSLEPLLNDSDNLVRDFVDSDWSKDALKAATQGQNSTSWAAALCSCGNTPLAGGCGGFQMGKEVGDKIYRSVKSLDKLSDTLDDGKITTMAELWKSSSEKYAARQCMGWRDIVSMKKDGVKEKYVLSSYNWITYRQARRRSENFGRGLASLGMIKGDIINFFSDTKKEWQLGLLGCYQQGYIVSTTYANLGADAVKFSFKETEGQVVFTDADLVPLINSILLECPSVKHVVFTSDPRPNGHPSSKTDEEIRALITAPGVQAHSFEEIEKLGEGNANCEDPKVNPDDLCVIMYTSGSTGNPKGVMISHGNMVAALSGICEAIPAIGEIENERYLAYLPLAHILEVLAESGILASGAALGYSSTKTLVDTSVCIEPGACRGDAPELAPTLMACVPMIMDRIRSALTTKIRATGGITEKLFNMGFKAKADAMAKGNDSPFWNKILFDKIRTKLLGGRVRYMLSGGGPLAKETQEFMNVVFCCPIGQGAGLTESSGCATTVWPNDRTCGRAGAPITCVQIKLVDWEEGGYFADPSKDPKHHPNPRGEILLAGKNIAMGYFKNPEKTAETFFVDDDGVRYLRTGDIGEMYPDGVLAIIDRKKSLIKLSGGEYVSLGKLEPLYMLSPYVENAMVYADPLKSYCVAVVTRPPGSEKLDDKVVYDSIVSILKENKCAKFEIPKRIFVAPDQWGPENDLCTAALKLKRLNLHTFYKEQLEQLYKD